MTPAALDALLEVQALDTIADQLRHRRDHLPERAELADRNAKLSELEAGAGEVQSERDTIAASEKRLEDEIALVAEKAKGADQKLYSGTVNVPRELTALQDEIASLQRRKGQLEDQELELMEQAEPLDATLAEMATRAHHARCRGGHVVGRDRGVGGCDRRGAGRCRREPFKIG